MRAFKPAPSSWRSSASGAPAPDRARRLGSNALPKRGFVLQGRHDIKLKVLAPLPAAEFAHQTVDELSDRVRRLIASELERGAGRS